MLRVFICAFYFQNPPKAGQAQVAKDGTRAVVSWLPATPVPGAAEVTGYRYSLL
jgi:hypothetical protein